MVRSSIHSYLGEWVRIALLGWAKSRSSLLIIRRLQANYSKKKKILKAQYARMSVLGPGWVAQLVGTSSQ